MYINKFDRTSHWVVHLKLKELDINNLLERKPMIDDLEVELTGALKETSNTDNSTVADEANVDEARTTEDKAINDIGNYLKYKQNK